MTDSLKPKNEFNQLDDGSHDSMDVDQRTDSVFRSYSFHANTDVQSRIEYADSDDESYANYPITFGIVQWIKQQNWHYKHKIIYQEALSFHHLIIDFAAEEDRYSDWRCVIHVSEKTKVVTFVGFLLFSLDEDYYSHLLLAFNDLNRSVILIGKVSIDLNSDTACAEVSLGASLSSLSKGALAQYMYNLTGMIQLMYKTIMHIYDKAMPYEDFEHTLGCYVSAGLNAKTDTEHKYENFHYLSGLKH